jgi:hypothetical protein
MTLSLNDDVLSPTSRERAKYFLINREHHLEQCLSFTLVQLGILSGSFEPQLFAICFWSGSLGILPGVREG